MWTQAILMGILLLTADEKSKEKPKDKPTATAPKENKETKKVDHTKPHWHCYSDGNCVYTGSTP